MFDQIRFNYEGRVKLWVWAWSDNRIKQRNVLSVSKLVIPNTISIRRIILTRRVWGISDTLLKKSSCPKCNEHKRRILLKLFMQIKFIWQGKDYTFSGPHQWNVNIRIGSVMKSRCRCTNDFDSSGGKMMKFIVSGHRSLLIEVRGKCKYIHQDIRNILR